MKSALKHIYILYFNLIFFASFGSGATTGGTIEPCVISEHGYYGNQDVAEPVFEQIRYYYQLEHEKDAPFRDLLHQLEIAMAQDVIKYTSLFSECQQQSRRTLLSKLRSLVLPGSRIEVKPAISTRPVDEEDTKKHCPESSAETKCLVMVGTMSFYYPFSNRAEFEPRVPQITTDIRGVIANAMDNGEYIKISGISRLKYLSPDEYEAMPAEPQSEQNTDLTASSGTDVPNETEEKKSFLFPIIACSVIAGTLILSAALFHVRNKIRSKKGSKFEGRVVSESNVV